MNVLLFFQCLSLPAFVNEDSPLSEKTDSLVIMLLAWALGFQVQCSCTVWPSTSCSASGWFSPVSAEQDSFFLRRVTWQWKIRPLGALVVATSYLSCWESHETDQETKILQDRSCFRLSGSFQGQVQRHRVSVPMIHLDIFRPAPFFSPPPPHSLNLKIKNHTKRAVKVEISWLPSVSCLLNVHLLCWLFNSNSSGKPLLRSCF